MLTVVIEDIWENILAKFEGIWSLGKFRQLIILSTTVLQHISYFSLFSFSNFSKRKNHRIKFFTPFDSAFNEEHLSLSFFHLMSTRLLTVRVTYALIVQNIVDFLHYYDTRRMTVKSAKTNYICALPIILVDSSDEK